MAVGVALGELAHAAAHQQPDEQQGNGNPHRSKPPCLVERRRHDEGQGRRLRAPQAVLVGGDHAEHVVTRREVGVVRGALRADVLPAGIDAVELHAELHALGLRQRTGGEMQVDFLRSDRQRRGLQRPGATTCIEREDLHRRRKRVAADVGRVDPDDAVVRREPQLAVLGHHRGRHRTQLRGRAIEAVVEVEALRRDGMRRVGESARNLVGGQPDDTQNCIDPEVARGVGDDAGDARDRLASVDADRVQVAVDCHRQPELAAQPHARARRVLRTQAQQAPDLQAVGRAPLGLRAVGRHHHEPVERIAEPKATLRIARHRERVGVRAAGRLVDMVPAGRRRRVLLPLAVARDREPHAAAADVHHRLHRHARDLRRQRHLARHVAADLPDAARAGHPHVALRVAHRARDAWANLGQASFVAAQARRRNLRAARPYALARGRRERRPQQVGRQRGTGELVGAEAVEAPTGSDPHAAFAILQDREDLVAAQALVAAEAQRGVGLRVAVRFERRHAVGVDEPRQATEAADPQRAVAIETQRSDMTGAGHVRVQRWRRVAGGQRPDALRTVRLPHAAVGALREPRVADRSARALEAHAAPGQAPRAVLGDGPHCS